MFGGRVPGGRPAATPTRARGRFNWVLPYAGPLPRSQAYALAAVLTTAEVALFITQREFCTHYTGLVIGWPLLLLMWLAGGGPTVLHTVVVMTAATLMLFPPYRSFTGKAPDDVMRIVLGTLTFLIGALISHVMHRSQREARERATELAASEQRFRLLVDQAADGIFLADASDRFLLVNPSGCAMLGYTQEELQQLRVEEVLLAEQTQMPMQPGAGSDGLLVLEGERWMRRKDGSSFLAEVSVRDLGEGNRQAIVHDVTRRHEALARLHAAEERVRQGERMEALGRLAGGVAHDFNNLLAVIRGYGELVRSDLPSASPLREQVQEILGAAERGSSLTRQLLAFSRSQPVEPRRVEPDAILHTMQGMLARLMSAEVRIEFRPGAPDAAIWIDPTQLEQIVMNLAINASDASREGGGIRLITRTRASAAHHAGVFVLRVEDDGAGIDESTREHMFEPFFTTKAPGKGTGLGLATVYGIVRQQDGQIEVSSTLGSGTTIQVEFPMLVSEPASVAGEPSAREHEMTPATDTEEEVRMHQDPHGTQSVLLVDDEEALRTLGERVLRRAGFRVRTAQDVASAWAMVQQEGYRPHAVILDLEMPGVSGLHLARRFREAAIDARFLVVSGMLDRFEVDEQDLGQDWRVLAKPYTPDMLVSEVRALLSPSAATP